jgi:hypothetical protein
LGSKGCSKLDLALDFNFYLHYFHQIFVDKMGSFGFLYIFRHSFYAKRNN